MIRKYLPKSFFPRSLLILVLPVIFIHVISGYVFFHRHWDSIRQLLAQNIATEIHSLLEYISHHGFEPARTFAHAHHDIDLSKESSLPPSRVAPLYFQQSLSHHIPYPFEVIKTRQWLTVWVKKAPHIYRFCMASKRLAPRTTLLFILWALGSSVVFLVIAAIVMRNQIRPLHRLVSWTKELEKDNPNPLPKIEGAREIRAIAAAIQMVITRIRRGFEERNRMLMDISHDLRTPLARLKLQLQLLPSNEDTCGLQQDVDQMITMVNTYLTFAKEEQEPLTFVYIAPLVKELTSSFSSLKVSLNVPQDLALPLRPIQFRRCLQNLLNNAATYARSRLHVEAKLRDQRIFICIEDDGEGVPLPLREKIFSPFFRADEARSLEEENIGLGLSIVKSIVLSHGGRIHVSDSSLGGAAFCMDFPSQTRLSETL